MAEKNGRAPSLSPPSENDSSDRHSPVSFATLSGGGATRGYMISLSNPNNTNTPATTTNNNNLVPPPPPPSSNGYCLIPKEDPTTASKRPRGRPPGSKNKPKPPILIREDTDTLLKPIIIEIPAGNDVVESLITFARRRNAGISVLSGTGPVSDVTLRHPVSRAPAFPIQGPFNMLSLTGTYVNANCARVPPQIATNPAYSSFSIYLSGGRGQVFGGVVGGKVVASGVVLVTASLFKRPEFHRVAFINGSIEEVDEDDAVYAGGVINADHHAEPPNGIPNNTNNSSSSNAASIVSAFGAVGASSTQLNRQLPPPSADVNVMQWNHSTRNDSY